MIRPVRNLLLCILLGSGVSLYSQQQFTITGKVIALPRVKFYFSRYIGERIKTIDSIVSDSLSRFTFRLKTDAAPGMYRVSWGKDKNVNLIWNREEVNFSTMNDSPEDSLRIVISEENRIYRLYRQFDRSSQQKLELLMPLVDDYPRENSFYTQAITEYENVQKNDLKLLDSLDKSHPGSYAIRIFRNEQTPFLPASLTKEERIYYLRQHFFDHADFQDTLLLNSNAWANKAISYLSLYGNSKLDKKQLEAEFIKAVTVMLSAAAVNAEIYKFLLDYVVGGFDKYGFDGVITYMADNFRDPFSCEDQDRKTTLQKKLDNFKKLSIGKTAPEIIAPDTKGKQIKLSEIRSDYILVIFWSSECGHCAQTLPKILDVYNSQKPKRFEVIAVSVDTSKSGWTKFIRDEKLNWINVSELKGFNCKAADDYNVFATPTMFLLDREKKILSKPISYREVDEALREQKLIQ